MGNLGVIAILNEREARSYETELLFKCRVVGAEDVGVAVVSETSFD
jgi:hypothetical protein